MNQRPDPNRTAILGQDSTNIFPGLHFNRQDKEGISQVLSPGGEYEDSVLDEVARG